MQYVPSMLGATLEQTSIDAGSRWSFTTAAGQPVQAWGERGFNHSFAYDDLRRPTHRWLHVGSTDTLVERLVYGELHADAATNYLRGKLVARYDQAGVVLTESYDFKGNLLAQTRRLAVDYEDTVGWSALGEETDPADILDAAESSLEGEEFTHTYAFDALNRPTSVTLPDDTLIQPSFDAGGFLQSVEAYLRGSSSATSFVDDIQYDEHGRRTSISYAVTSTTLTTRYEYDPLSRRLTHFETERGSATPAVLLQSVDYTYDAVGNITRLTDGASQSLYFSASSVESADRDFTYSAVYRLIQAIGREHGSGADVQLDEDERPIHAIPHPNDPTGFWGYTESYAYDAVGNILTLTHDPDATGIDTWIREYTYEDTPDCNRLVSTTNDSSSRDYTHDEHGNMVSMPHLETMDWDYADELRHVDKGSGTGQETWFVYDATGERVRKVYVHNGLREERIYLGGYELYRKYVVSPESLEEERETVHIADDQRRVCMVETLTVADGTVIDEEDIDPRLRFQLDDHLGTACVEVDGSGAVISFEEYHPYGTSSYRSFQSSEVSAKRYRYTGKERDEETGLAYHGARYFCPWLGRWTSPDPAGLVDGANLYAYCRGDPVGGNDPTGLGNPNPPPTVSVPPPPSPARPAPPVPAAGPHIPPPETIGPRHEYGPVPPVPPPRPAPPPPPPPTPQPVVPEVPADIMAAAERGELAVSPSIHTDQYAATTEQAQRATLYFLTAVNAFATHGVPIERALPYTATAWIETTFRNAPNSATNNLTSWQPNPDERAALVARGFPLIAVDRGNGPYGSRVLQPVFGSNQQSIEVNLEISYGIGGSSGLPPGVKPRLATAGAALVDPAASVEAYGTGLDAGGQAGVAKPNDPNPAKRTVLKFTPGPTDPPQAVTLRTAFNRVRLLAEFALSNLPASISPESRAWAERLVTRLPR